MLPQVRVGLQFFLSACTEPGGFRRMGVWGVLRWTSSRAFCRFMLGVFSNNGCDLLVRKINRQTIRRVIHLVSFSRSTEAVPVLWKVSENDCLPFVRPCPFRLLAASVKSPLFDTLRITDNLEKAYQAMWEVREMRIPASHIGTIVCLTESCSFM